MANQQLLVAAVVAVVGVVGMFMLFSDHAVGASVACDGTVLYQQAAGGQLVRVCAPGNPTFYRYQDDATLRIQRGVPRDAYANPEAFKTWPDQFSDPHQGN